MEVRRKCLVNGTTEAHFDQYGTQIIYDDAGQPLQRTVAVVETTDGKVLEVEPSQIKFTK